MAGCLSRIKEYEIEKMDLATGKWVRAGKVPGSVVLPYFDVENLEPGHQYKFRVTAVNAEGDSEPLESDHAITAKNPYGAPGAPGKPEIIDYDEKSVQLKFNAPENDGGAPLLKYVVQKKDRFLPDWETAAEVKCDTCKPLKPGEPVEVSVTGLKHKAEYMFRVVAVNKAGPGPESEPTDYHLVRHRALKPRIDRTHLKQTVVKAGKNIKFDINVDGEPAPTIKWFRNDDEISEENTTIENVDYNTKLTVVGAVRKQTGVYKIVATNEHGTDEATVEVTVLSAPSKPKGPLKVTDVTKKGCKLEWEKPEDDGGLPVKEYLVEKMDTATGRWMPVGRTKDTDMDVPGLSEGKEYLFRVKAVNDEGDSEPLEADAAIVAKDPYGPPGKPSMPEIFDWDVDRVDLKWEPPKSSGGAPITSYIIEKKERYGSSWEQIHESKGPGCECRVPGLTEIPRAGREQGGAGRPLGPHQATPRQGPLLEAMDQPREVQEDHSQGLPEGALRGGRQGRTRA